MTQLFVVLSGKHHQGGRVYTKGQQVASSTDLVAAFPNKFQRLSSELDSPAPQAASGPAPPAPAAPTAEPEIAAGAQDAPETAAEAGDGADTPSDVPEGVDVTDRFDAAVDACLHVYAKAGWHFIYEADNHVDPLNEKGLRADGVEAFIAQRLAEEAGG